jgi:hypothetical protein
MVLRVASAADEMSQWKRRDPSQDDLVECRTTGNENGIVIVIESVITIVSVNAVVQRMRAGVVAVAERNNENGRETTNANVAGAVILEEPGPEKNELSLERPRAAELARARKTVDETAERGKIIPSLDRAVMSTKAVSDLLLLWVDHLRRHHHLPFRLTRKKIEDGVQAPVAATAAVSYGTGIETGIATADGIGTTIAMREAGDLTENEAALEETMDLDLVTEEVVEAEEACEWEGKTNGPGEGNECDSPFVVRSIHSSTMFFASYLIWSSISLHLLDGVCCITTTLTRDSSFVCGYRIQFIGVYY